MSITDPTVMRALAHPVRMALIELFGVHATLTATQASEALGESPANCAFHLRTLARYGFVEEAGGGRGRERPWRASKKSLRIRLRQSELDSEQAQVAAGALEQVWHDRLFARIREAFVNRRWSPEWEQAAGSSLTLAFFTAGGAANGQERDRRGHPPAPGRAPGGPGAAAGRRGAGGDRLLRLPAPGPDRPAAADDTPTTPARATTATTATRATRRDPRRTRLTISRYILTASTRRDTS